MDKISLREVNLWYGDFHALKNISMDMGANRITAFIGPSGCGKSTLLKSLNRMNDLVEGCRVSGQFLLDGRDIYRQEDVNALRKRVGMVFQKPNPFPMSVYDNIAYGPRTHGIKNRAKLDEIVEKALRFRGDETVRKALDVTWNALEDYAPQGNALCVIDGSGSMYGWGNPYPITVALSLGMYFAEHCKGEFHNHFITFSHNPKLVEIKGKDLVEKVQYCETFNEVANTNVQKVFELILSTAVKNRLPQEELPETLYFISDMEFDYCTNDASLTNFEYAKKLFEDHGYRLPKVVFWNVQSRKQQQPVSMNEQGVILISGCTPRIFSMVANGKFDPILLMKEVLLSERYAPVCA